MDLKDGPFALDGNISAQFYKSLVPVVFSIELLGKLSETLDDFWGLVNCVLLSVVPRASVATSVVATATAATSPISTTYEKSIHNYN